MLQSFDVVVVGGGPAGATAAAELAARGRSVMLLDRQSRARPCGVIPPKLIEEFAVPEELLVARVTSATMVAPSRRRVDMPIEGGFVGMVNRAAFDEWLRSRAAAAGAHRCSGAFEGLSRDLNGGVVVQYKPDWSADHTEPERVRARAVVGADGAVSAVARHTIARARYMPYAVLYHEVMPSPLASRANFDPSRCDLYFSGAVSPDFYGWVFPHGCTTSVGSGTAQKGFSLRRSVAALRRSAGFGEVETLRREGAPIPLRPLPRWDNGRDVVLAGDAAGAVAPASGEGIYYAMVSGRLAAEAVDQFCASGDPRVLAEPRKRFMKAHGRVFWMLGMMQRFWYVSDRRRERFVSICRDPDVQRLTWEAYMYKRLVRAQPAAHLRIFFKDLAHLLGLVSA